jgi:hypothetical protein
MSISIPKDDNSSFQSIFRLCVKKVDLTLDIKRMPRVVVYRNEQIGTQIPDSETFARQPRD